MNRLETLITLNNYLLEDMPRYKNSAKNFAKDEQMQWKLFRSLVNIRKAKPIGKDFLNLQDEFLQEIALEKGITDIKNLEPISKDEDKLYLWQGDITTLKVDAIVNAANCRMTGCYAPMHMCIDNAIHTFAGVQLRLECAKIIDEQGHLEETGRAKLTNAYNLPSKYVIHTVGPIIHGKLTDEDREKLASCYHSCLDIAYKYNLKSIAFCCISTGEFHFPQEEAGKIAIKVVKESLKEYSDKDLAVVFNVFKNMDLKIYQELLK